MSLTMSAARRRLSLFTGSSMAAASVFAAIGTGAILAPTAALAANECGVQAGTALIVCPPGTYPGGITYSSTATLNLSTAGAVDVSATGVDITGNGSNNVTLTTTAGAVSGAGGIDVRVDGGSAVVNAGVVAGGIYAESRRNGVSVVSTGGDISARVAQVLTNNSQTSISGAASVTGNGNITVFHTGSGAITTNSSGGVGVTHITKSHVTRPGGVGAVSATVGSGGLILDITGNAAEGAPTVGSTGNPIYSAGEVGVNGLTVQGSGSAVVNIWRDEFRERLVNYPGFVSIAEDYAKLTGAVNLSGLAGGATFNVNRGGTWQLSGSTQLTAADDTVLIGEGAFLHTSIWGSNSNPPPLHTVSFGAGTDALINEGRILVGVESIDVPDVVDSFMSRDRHRYEAELVLQGLETFENRGEIWLGTSIVSGVPGALADLLNDPDIAIYARGTDRVTDDILTMEGVTFISDGGRIFMDINLDYLGSAQDRCDATLRDVNGDLPAADCINLQNGSAEGVIVLSLTNSGVSQRGAFNPNGIVVIDMSDGAGGAGSSTGGAAAQVVMSPDMAFYNPNFGGVLDTGMFMALPIYDAELMQFKIVGAPSGGAFHQPLVVNGAQQAWRAANATFFDRQADLRDTLRGEDRTSGLWMRAGYEKGQREAQHVFSIPSGDIAYDNTHDLNIASLTVGGDFVGSVDGDDSWVVGGLLGYVRTDIEYDSWTDAASMNGLLVGGYASLVNGPLFFDASLSGLWNRMDQTLPQAELFRDSTLKTDLNTVGAQAEGGLRFDLGVARIEPLVNASWVRTRARDFKVPDADPLRPGNQVMFEEAISTRAGVGLRGSTLMPAGPVSVGLSLTGRYSREFDGEASAAIGNLNPISPVVVDEFDGDFGELVAGVTVADHTGRLSGVLNVGGRQGDDYESITASAGFRYQW